MHRPKLGVLVTEIAEVIDRAHAAGIVHRDLKPHNLFLTSEGAPGRCSISASRSSASLPEPEPAEQAR